MGEPAASPKATKGWVSGEQSLAMLDSVGGSAVENSNAFHGTLEEDGSWFETV
jgi:hypothetical protein